MKAIAACFAKLIMDYLAKTACAVHWISSSTSQEGQPGGKSKCTKAKGSKVLTVYSIYCVPKNSLSTASAIMTLEAVEAALAVEN